MDVAVHTEAVLLQQIPISSLALSLQEHTPRVRMGLAVHTEAVLLQQVPISSLALSLQEHPPRVRMGWRFSHRGGALTADPDILVSSVLVGAPAPGCE